ncbi:MAG: transporter substrate-binding domain-containing protein [Deltaproteobacteria bacterium]|nr:transporter substrate-binding domain-containing protein [Deltaproteobacteria bacterium]
MLRKTMLIMALLGVLCTWAEAREVVFAVPQEAYPPVHSVHEDGTVVGFSHELMQAICRHAGITPVMKATPWGTLFDDIAAGKFAASIAASTITDARKKKVDFSDMYFEAEETVVVRKGEGIRKEKDLTNKKIGAWGATTNFEACRTFARFNNAKSVVPFPDTETAMLGLSRGTVDAVFTDSPTAVSYVFENERFAGKLELAFTLPATIPDLFGFAVNKKETELLAQINAGLKALRDSGEYDRLYAKWFPALAKKDESLSWFKWLWK